MTDPRVSVAIRNENNGPDWTVIRLRRPRARLDEDEVAHDNNMTAFLF
jgi:hypothetical protein